MAIQEVYNSTLLGSLIIGGSIGYYNANGLDLEIGGNFVNNNTNASTGLNVGGFQAQSDTQTTSFLGTGESNNHRHLFQPDQFCKFRNSDGFGAHSISHRGGCTIVVNDDLTLTSGTFNDGGNSIYLLGDVDNNAIHISPNATAGGMILLEPRTRE